MANSIEAARNTPPEVLLLLALEDFAVYTIELYKALSSVSKITLGEPEFGEKLHPYCKILCQDDAKYQNLANDVNEKLLNADKSLYHHFGNKESEKIRETISSLTNEIRTSFYPIIDFIEGSIFTIVSGKSKIKDSVQVYLDAPQRHGNRFDSLQKNLSDVIQKLKKAIGNSNTNAEQKGGEELKRGNMIPTAGQFRKLVELFEKDAKKLPGLSHTIRPIKKSSMDVEVGDNDKLEYYPNDYEIYEVEKLHNNIDCGMWYPFIAYDSYFTDEDVCVGYLTKPLIYGKDANDKKSFVDFTGLGESAGNLLRQIPNHLISDVGTFCSLKRDSYDINLWLVFLHELEGNQLKENRRSEVKNVFLKSALACEGLADRLEKADTEQNSGQSIDSQNKQEDIIDLKPNFCGIGLNINALIRKRTWWIKIKNLLKAFIYKIFLHK